MDVRDRSWTSKEPSRASSPTVTSATSWRPPVGQAAALMIESHVGSLPVIEHDRLVGIVTDRDAVKALAAQVPALRYAAQSLW